MQIYEKSDDSVKWKLLQYVSPAGRKSIEDWRSDLSIVCRTDFDTYLRNIAKRSKWTYPDVGGLSGKHLKGFCELRWRSGNGVPHRIGGYFASDNEFVMLIGWTHNRKKYDPPSALELMVDRKKKFQKGEATVCEYTILTSRAA